MFNKIKKYTWLICAIITAAFMIAACDSIKTPTQETINRAGQPLTITVHIYKDKQAVTKAYREWMGDNLHKDANADAVRLGWSEWAGKNRCAIHVTDIEYMQQKDRFETWGHELKHCISGRFH